MNRRIVFLIGASGVGKTAVAQMLAGREPWSGNTSYSDTIGVPSPEEMELWPGGAEGWQRWATEQWVSRLAEKEASLQLLEMQTRLSFIIPALESHPEIDSRIILLDCSAPVRSCRLTELRQQPELATARMEDWADYLRKQAATLGIPVIQTDGLTPEEVAAAVEAAALDPT